MELYPLQFEPIFKERIWGGSKLKSLLNKSIPSNHTGESWEISSVENDVSIVANGFLKGKSLNDIVQEFPVELLGTKVFSLFGKQFPLLFKFLDAQEDLSIQLHPNDALAKKYHNSFGKTEMWYVMQADQDSRLIIGFKEDSSSEDYLTNLKNKTLLDILEIKNATQGDVYFLETGTIHAIGAGTVIAEIQQTSDITYRVYDFDRTDAQGNLRELHLDLALQAINYKKQETQKTYSKVENTANEVVQCEFFTTNFIPLQGEILVAMNNSSFKVYMCVEGSFSLIVDEVSTHYKKGDTILIPACLPDFHLKGIASILEIYIS